MTLQVIVGIFFISSFVFDSMWIKQFFFKILFSVCQLFLTELEWCFCPTEDLAIIISVFHSLGFQYVSKLNRKLVTFLTIHYIILNLHKLKKKSGNILHQNVFRWRPCKPSRGFGQKVTHTYKLNVYISFAIFFIFGKSFLNYLMVSDVI